MLKFLRVIYILPIILGFCLSNVSAAAPQQTSDLDDDTLFLAATLWGEARHDDSIGMQVVANTVLNRKKYYEQQSNGKTLSIKDIVSHTDQYASWKDKNWDSSDIINNMVQYQGPDKEKWESCVRIAKLALKGRLADITGGATNYYSKDAENIPDWARGEENTSTINNHVVVRGVNMENLTDGSNNVMVQGGTAYKAANPWENYTMFPKDIKTDLSESSCTGVESLSRDISSTTNSGYGILSDKTMQNMTDMLNRIYKNLGRVFMLGHGMLCYASKVAYSCLGLDVPGLVSACYIKMPHMSFFISGLAIYFTAFLMSIAIGMYFIDISFKLGFAIMYLPVAIALWPFAPTRSKFGEVFAMILSNAMLYAFMSIGLTYAIILIYNGVLGDAGNWTNFWSAIEKESSEILAENFSLSSTRIIVVLFCIIFGFKILASSVHNYLNYFFSDGLLGGESPMHHLGTQAFGTFVVASAARAGGFVSDVASTQAGRVIEAGGDWLESAADGDFGAVGRFFNGAKDNMVKAHQYVSNRVSSALDNASDNPSTPTGGGATPTGGGTPPSGGSTPPGDGSGGASSVTTGDSSTETNASNEKSFLREVAEQTRPDENTLRPSNIISKTSSTIGNGLSATASAIVHPQVTYRTFKQLATENISDENSAFQNGKIIVTNTGKVLFRKFTPESLREGLSEDKTAAQNVGTFAKNTAAEGGKIARATVSDTVGFIGRMTRRLGQNMQQNWKKPKGENYWAKKEAERELEKEREALKNEVNRSDMNDND